MSRVETVAKARKSPGSCGKCSRVIQASEGYRHTKLNRFSGRKVRRMKPECAFKQSDLTSNDKLSQLYAAQEAAETDLAAWKPADGAEALKDIVSTLKDEVEAVKDQFEEAAQNIEDGFQHETQQSEELREKASELESWAGDLDGIDIDDEPERDEDDDDCEACNGLGVVDEESGDAFADEAKAEEAKAAGKSADCDDCGGSGENSEAGDDHDQAVEDWAEEQRSKVEEAIGGCPL